MDLNLYKKRIYANACEHGFYDYERTNAPHLMLVICELSEMVQADRKLRHADRDRFEASDRSNYAFAMYIKDTVEDEIADVVMRLLSLAGHKKIDMAMTTKDIRRIHDYNYNEWRFLDPVKFAFDLICILTSCDDTLEARIHDVLLNIWRFCEVQNIELKYFIIQKMWYNRHRPYMHGAAY